MKIKYKKVTKLVPCCGICGDELYGNNSYVLPYYCKCGIWQSTYGDPSKFELVKAEIIKK